MWTLEESIDSYLGGVEGVPWHPSPNGKKYRSSDHQKGKTRQERWSLVESWTQGMTIYENSDVECGIILRSSMNIQNLKMRSRCSSSSSGSLKLIPELEIERYQRKMALTKDLFDQLVEESCEGPDSYVLRTISQMNLSPRQQTLQGCKCTKIDCLKMYCECFSKGRVCN